MITYDVSTAAAVNASFGAILDNLGVDATEAEAIAFANLFYAQFDADSKAYANLLAPTVFPEAA